MHILHPRGKTPKELLEYDDPVLKMAFLKDIFYDLESGDMVQISGNFDGYPS